MLRHKLRQLLRLLERFYALHRRYFDGFFAQTELVERPQRRHFAVDRAVLLPFFLQGNDVDDRGEFELKLVDDSNEPLKSFVETFKNERALGEYFKACFTAMYQDANISEENKQILLNGMTNIIAGNISVKEIIQIYNKISPVYHIIPCYLLSDLVVCIYRGDYNFWGDDDVF